MGATTLGLLREATPADSSPAATGSFSARGADGSPLRRGGAIRRDLERGTLSSELELPEVAVLVAIEGALASCPGGASVPKRSPTD